MNNINRYAWLIVVVVLATWVVLILVRVGSLSISVDAFKQIPDVVTIDVLISIAFIKWGWKWKILRGWLVSYPDLSGNWKGRAVPKSINEATGCPYDPVELDVSIRQTFLATHIRVYSKEMESNSNVASFILDNESNEKRLCYTYTSIPKANIRDRSPIHNGSALLTIKGTKEDTLEGEYWTSRATTGELYFYKQK
jgi:hypothetical protein